MADSTIPELTTASTIDGSELLIVNQAGTDKKASAQQIITALVQSGGGAPADASYVVISPNATLSGERTLASTTSIIVDTVTNSNQVSIRRAALTGDVTAPENSNSTVIANNAVSNAKADDMPANTIKANPTSSTADPQDLAIGTNQLVGRGASDIVALTLGSNLSITGSTLNANAATGAPTDAEYIVASANANLSAERVVASSTSITADTATAGQITYKRAALTGVVTAAEDSNTTTITADAVTNAMLANMGANTIKCNNTASAADPKDVFVSANTVLGRGPTGNITALTLGPTLNVTGTTLNAASAGAFTFGYTSADTTDSDPTAGLIKFNHASNQALITKIMISNTTANGQDISAYIDEWKVDSLTVLTPSGVSSSTYLIVSVTGVTNNTTYRTITCAVVAGTMPALGVSYEIANYPGVNLTDLLAQKVVRTDTNGDLIDYQGNVIPTGGETLASLLAAGMVRTNSSGQLINGANEVISGTSSVADQAALIALDAALYENHAIIPASGLNRSVWVSNGNQFNALNGQYIQERATLPVKKVIACNTGITWTVAQNGSTVRATASAAHGLTTTPAVGSSLYLTNTPANWDAASHHEISAVVSTTVIDLTTPWVAGMGVPVFAAANVEMPLKIITLPILRANTEVECQYEIGHSVDAGGSSRRIRFYLDATKLNDFNTTSTTNAFNTVRHGFLNQNSTSSQRGLVGENSTGYAVNTLLPLTAAVDTSVTGKTIKIAAVMAAANLYMELLSYKLFIRS